MGATQAARTSGQITLYARNLLEFTLPATAWDGGGCSNTPANTPPRVPFYKR